MASASILARPRAYSSCACLSVCCCSSLDITGCFAPPCHSEQLHSPYSQSRKFCINRTRTCPKQSLRMPKHQEEAANIRKSPAARSDEPREGDQKRPPKEIVARALSLTHTSMAFINIIRDISYHKTIIMPWTANGNVTTISH
eukprot:1747185-Prymnesium_polylepis.1